MECGGTRNRFNAHFCSDWIKKWFVSCWEACVCVHASLCTLCRRPFLLCPWNHSFPSVRFFATRYLFNDFMFIGNSRLKLIAIFRARFCARIDRTNVCDYFHSTIFPVRYHFNGIYLMLVSMCTNGGDNFLVSFTQPIVMHGNHYMLNENSPIIFKYVCINGTHIIYSYVYIYTCMGTSKR